MRARVRRGLVAALAAACAAAACEPEPAAEQRVGAATSQSTDSAATQASDSLPRVFPADEAAQDPAFFAFRFRLQRAVAERDTAALLAAVDSGIKLSFGPRGTGLERFRDMWLRTAGGPGASGGDVWSELGTVLALGGRFTDDSTFVAPYTFNAFEPGEEPPGFDPFQSLIAIGDAVPVLAAASPAGADTLALLSFEVVRHEWRSSAADPPAGWIAVRLASDSLGFVRSGSVRSPIDYRAIFSRRGGRWRMMVFVAGD